MFDPRTLPTEIPIVLGFIIENRTTTSSGREVEKATSMNPILVFPKPVTLAKLTELVIVKLLALIKTTNEAIRTAMFPILPSCSNTLLVPPLIHWKRNSTNISVYLLRIHFQFGESIATEKGVSKWLKGSSK
jgi:hypothetical protein